MANKRGLRRAGRDLEIGDRLAAVRGFAFLKHLGQVAFRDQLAPQTDAFVKPRQMRRGIGVNRLARRLKPRPDHRLRRSLAVRPGDVDHRRQVALGVAEAVE